MALAVLYSELMEPLTVIDVESRVWEILSRGGEAILPVCPEPVFTLQHPIYAPPGSFQAIRVRGVRFTVDSNDCMLLVTPDAADVFLLRSALLPGQAGRMQRERQRTVSPYNWFVT